MRVACSAAAEGIHGCAIICAAHIMINRHIQQAQTTRYRGAQSFCTSVMLGKLSLTSRDRSALSCWTCISCRVWPAQAMAKHATARVQAFASTGRQIADGMHCRVSMQHHTQPTACSACEDLDARSKHVYRAGLIISLSLSAIGYCPSHQQ